MDLNLDFLEVRGFKSRKRAIEKSSAVSAQEDVKNFKEIKKIIISYGWLALRRK